MRTLVPVGEKETFDSFEVCPACGEWSLRARVSVWGEEDYSAGTLLANFIAFDLRCLNCGFKHKEVEVDPLSSSEEELMGLLGRLARELGRSSDCYFCGTGILSSACRRRSQKES